MKKKRKEKRECKNKAKQKSNIKKKGNEKREFQKRRKVEMRVQGKRNCESEVHIGGMRNNMVIFQIKEKRIPIRNDKLSRI